MIVQNSILPDLSNHKYRIQIARNNDEIDNALSLRYDIFNLELKRGFNFNEGRDSDEYDDQCHHLLVKMKSTDEIVGTYRLQTWENAQKGKGFYSAKRFRIDQLDDQILRNSIEVGRACIKEDHRSGRVLFLLWKGLAGYLQHFDKRYLFGSSALQTTNSAKANKLLVQLNEAGDVDKEYIVDVKSDYSIDQSRVSSDDVSVPPLFRNYLDVGAKICGGPALDRKAGSAYFLTLLDIDNISDRTRKIFFGAS
jgi:putative hemolysin